MAFVWDPSQDIYYLEWVVLQFYSVPLVKARFLPQSGHGHFFHNSTQLTIYYSSIVWCCRDWHTHTHTHTLTYLLTPWSRVLIEKRNSSQLVKKFPAFYGTQRFIIALTHIQQCKIIHKQTYKQKQICKQIFSLLLHHCCMFWYISYHFNRHHFMLFAQILGSHIHIKQYLIF